MTYYTIPSPIGSAELRKLGEKYKAEHGDWPDYDKYAELIAEHVRLHWPDQSLAPMIVCGDLGAQCIDCGNVSDALCDFPVGHGKTCDRAICSDCAPEIQPNLNYCTAHRTEWEKFRAEKLAGVLMLTPGKKPPRRRKPMRIV